VDAIECIFCDGSTSSVVIQENGFDARQCANCGLIFVSPRPSADETAALYVTDSAHLSAKSHVEAQRTRVSRAETRYRLSVLRKYIRPGSTIAEIGAGGGAFLEEARTQGFDAQGVELNPLQAGFIRDQLGIPCAPSLAELQQSTGRQTHDVVFFRDVISHFSDPIAEFATFNEALPPGGIIAFETGNLADVDHRYFRYFSLFQLPDHLFFFGDASLKALLSLTGFELITIRRWSILPQLRALHLLHRLRGRNAGTEQHRSEQSDDVPAEKRSSLGEAVIYVLYHLLPARVGAVAPKKGRPQTTLVVARKTGPSSN
jgi:SAM-dependent methyltransferase